MKTDELEKLKKECEACRRCKLCESRTNTVFGRGDINADVMFIGEAPGEKEDLSGMPFCGAAGKVLKKYLDIAKISEDNIFIANILKCRPPKNRDPKPSEEDECIGYLERQIELIDPKIIVCLGRISAKRLIKKDFSITEEHGKIFDINGRKIMTVYHPAALIYDRKKSEDEETDFKKIAELIKTV